MEDVSEKFKREAQQLILGHGDGVMTSFTIVTVFDGANVEFTSDGPALEAVGALEAAKGQLLEEDDDEEDGEGVDATEEDDNDFSGQG